MKKINETMQVRMTLDEANLVNELIKRNEPMAIKAKTYDDNDKTYYYCPVCSKCIGFTDSIDQFCGACGQRMDTENIEF